MHANFPSDLAAVITFTVLSDEGFVLPEDFDRRMAN
jgi:hypothetical protein